MEPTVAYQQISSVEDLKAKTDVVRGLLGTEPTVALSGMFQREDGFIFAPRVTMTVVAVEGGQIVVDYNSRQFKVTIHSAAVAHFGYHILNAR